jgi:hypothetical protein
MGSKFLFKKELSHGSKIDPWDNLSCRSNLYFMNCRQEKGYPKMAQTTHGTDE